MNFFEVAAVAFRKVRRTGILPVLALAAVVLWIPSIVNAHLNFTMQAEGISPENNFFIQGFMAMVWFIYPACMVVVCVMLQQVERGNGGIVKMLSLPVRTSALCLGQFLVLLALSVMQFLFSAGMYLVSAAIASRTQGYNFFIAAPFVCRELGMLWASSVPMLALFAMLVVCVRTPIFSVGIGFASIVPSVLMINTKLWYLYPMAYPFYVITCEYAKLRTDVEPVSIGLVPLVPAALLITALCLGIACACFGRAERR